MGYRTWVYHESEPAKIVDSDDCEALYADGWQDLPFVKVDKEPVKVDKDEASIGKTGDPGDVFDRSVLKLEAESLGIKVDGRWSAERLKKEIEGVR